MTRQMFSAGLAHNSNMESDGAVMGISHIWRAVGRQGVAKVITDGVCVRACARARVCLCVCV